MKLNPSRLSRQSGNILVYILGAIFLLGILTALVKGNVQEGAGIDADKLAVRAGQVIDYAAELERGVNYIISNGKSEADIRFAHPDSVVNYGLITDEPDRQVFDPLGGGVEYREAFLDINDGTQWQFYGTTHIPDIGTDTAAQSRAELIAVLPNVSLPFCERINIILKQPIDLTLDTDPAANGCIHASGTPFTGTYVNGASANTLTAANLPNSPTYQACIRCNGGTYHYYRVLLSR